MKIDTNTVNVLKNFSKINPSIVVQEGNVLKTISPTKTIMAKATVPTNFSKRFAIYNLDVFIALLSTFKDPTLKFGDKSVNISEDNRKGNFTYADENTVTKAPEKVYEMLSDRATRLRLAAEKAVAAKQLAEVQQARARNSLCMATAAGRHAHSLCASATRSDFCEDSFILQAYNNIKK